MRLPLLILPYSHTNLYQAVVAICLSPDNGSTVGQEIREGSDNVNSSKPEVNQRGNAVFRSFRQTERYQFDFKLCTREKGWKQYDTSQDAWYFGVWVHPEKRVIITYAEGDVTVVKCSTDESYHAELKSMAEFYGPPPPAFIVIDPVKHQVTNVYDVRPV